MYQLTSKLVSCAASQSSLNKGNSKTYIIRLVLIIKEELACSPAVTQRTQFGIGLLSLTLLRVANVFHQVPVIICL